MVRRKRTRKVYTTDYASRWFLLILFFIAGYFIADTLIRKNDPVVIQTPKQIISTENSTIVKVPY
jgi:uncharacterized protein HemY